MAESVNPEDAVANGWILEFVCYTTWKEFVAGDDCFYQGRDFLQGLLARSVESSPERQRRVKLIQLLCRLADGRDHGIRYDEDGDITALESSLPILDALVETADLPADQVAHARGLMKVQSVLVCCRDNDFEAAEEVFQRVWPAGSKQSAKDKKLRTEVSAVLKSRNPHHPIIQNRCRYDQFLQIMADFLHGTVLKSRNPHHPIIQNRCPYDQSLQIMADFLHGTGRRTDVPTTSSHRSWLTSFMALVEGSILIPVCSCLQVSAVLKSRNPHHPVIQNRCPYDQFLQIMADFLHGTVLKSRNPHHPIIQNRCPYDQFLQIMADFLHGTVLKSRNPHHPIIQNRCPYDQFLQIMADFLHGTGRMFHTDTSLFMFAVLKSRNPHHPVIQNRCPYDQFLQIMADFLHGTVLKSRNPNHPVSAVLKSRNPHHPVIQNRCPYDQFLQIMADFLHGTGTRTTPSYRTDVPTTSFYRSWLTSFMAQVSAVLKSRNPHHPVIQNRCPYDQFLQIMADFLHGTVLKSRNPNHPVIQNRCPYDQFLQIMADFLHGTGRSAVLKSRNPHHPIIQNRSPYDQVSAVLKSRNPHHPVIQNRCPYDQFLQIMADFLHGTVLKSRNPNHPIIQNRCPYDHFLQIMADFLQPIVDDFKPPFLLKAAQRVVRDRIKAADCTESEVLESESDSDAYETPSENETHPEGEEFVFKSRRLLRECFTVMAKEERSSAEWRKDIVDYDYSNLARDLRQTQDATASKSTVRRSPRKHRQTEEEETSEPEASKAKSRPKNLQTLSEGIGAQGLIPSESERKHKQTEEEETPEPEASKTKSRPKKQTASEGATAQGSIPPPEELTNRLTNGQTEKRKHRDREEDWHRDPVLNDQPSTSGLGKNVNSRVKYRRVIQDDDSESEDEFTRENAAAQRSKFKKWSRGNAAYGNGVKETWSSDEETFRSPVKKKYMYVYESDSEEEIPTNLPCTAASLHVPVIPARLRIITKSPPDITRKGYLRQRHQWMDSEVENLIKGVKKYGLGNWAKIKDNFRFNGRTNVNLKDKWRQLIKSGVVKEFP
ncbi:TERF2 [Branchiostoma lanceolatum]|uniref:TERF2 protein n=1 Tax=Branchiostoma lanceolatum TaxID=7740 RepID=A0A8K0EJM1_BRALA|nr:TERF2 [Branchiostoma lanceolatum]